MDIGNFYFLNDDYFTDFPDSKLMSNKENVNSVAHDRPCFYAVRDESTSIFWLIPFSSQLTKFRNVYQSKCNRYSKCDTIVFGDVLGREKAFLIQNMCPAIPLYVKNEYIDNNANIPVKVDGVLEKELITKAKKVLALQRQGKNLIFPDVLKIEAALIKQINKES